MGARAGADARATGMPGRCPFDEHDDLSAVWNAAYVTAAYQR